MEILAEFSDGFKLELGPQDAALFDVVCLNSLVIEPWIEAVDRKELAVLCFGLSSRPVEEDVIVNAQIVSEPEDNPVHLTFI